MDLFGIWDFLDLGHGGPREATGDASPAASAQPRAARTAPEGNCQPSRGPWLKDSWFFCASAVPFFPPFHLRCSFVFVFPLCSRFADAVFRAFFLHCVSFSDGWATTIAVLLVCPLRFSVALLSLCFCRFRSVFEGSVTVFAGPRGPEAMKGTWNTCFPQRRTR